MVDKAHPWSVEDTQSLKTLSVMDGTFNMPISNKKHLRLYGHLLCPYVEKVRLVLAAKQLPYQDVQINLERRAKWHYLLNQGFVPILETPSFGDSKHYMMFESKIIMDFLDAKYPDAPLYSKDPFHRAEQDLMIHTFGEIDRNLFFVLVSRGLH